MRGRWTDQLSASLIRLAAATRGSLGAAIFGPGEPLQNAEERRVALNEVATMPNSLAIK
jgi:hypothetical protein